MNQRHATQERERALSICRATGKSQGSPARSPSRGAAPPPHLPDLRGEQRCRGDDNAPRTKLLLSPIASNATRCRMLVHAVPRGRSSARPITHPHGQPQHAAIEVHPLHLVVARRAASSTLPHRRFHSQGVELQSGARYRSRPIPCPPPSARRSPRGRTAGSAE